MKPLSMEKKIDMVQHSIGNGLKRDRLMRGGAPPHDKDMKEET